MIIRIKIDKLQIKIKYIHDYKNFLNKKEIFFVF